jgi:hypothetical protein
VGKYPNFSEVSIFENRRIGAQRRKTAMISLQRIEVNREYDDRKRKMKRPVSVLGVSIRNSTSFGVFVFFLCQYAIVDSINLLPSGIIFNTIIMLIALEQAALEQRLEKIYPHQPLKTTQENKLLRGPHERVLQIRLTDPLFLINTVRCHEKKHKKEGPSKPTDNVSASPLDAKGPKERKKKELEA